MLNVIPQIAGGDNFFGGFADVSLRISGPNTGARISGTAVLDNASLATFIGSDRLTMDRLQGRIRFASNQIQVEQATGYMGGGRFTASGGASLDEELNLSTFRLDINGTNITVPIPTDFITTGDAKLEISGRRIPSGNLSTVVSGSISWRNAAFTRRTSILRNWSGADATPRSQAVGPLRSAHRGSTF